MQYQYCNHLRTISESKINLHKDEIVSKCPACGGKDKNVPRCEKCALEFKIIDRYVQANIPVDFWERDMLKFEGDAKLLRLYKQISDDFLTYYRSGKSTMLVGQHGVGKTFYACSVLKLASLKGYGSLYTTLGDAVNVLVYGNSETKFQARKELMMVSFLVLDEFDSRFIGNENAADLFGRILESIIRIRLQNCMPTILISNDKDPTKALGTNLGASIASLINGYVKKIPVIGPDFRSKDK